VPTADVTSTCATLNFDSVKAKEGELFRQSSSVCRDLNPRDDGAGGLYLGDGRTDGFLKRWGLAIEMDPGAAAGAGGGSILTAGGVQGVGKLVRYLKQVLQDDVKFVSLHFLHLWRPHWTYTQYPVYAGR
jgi:hypothetical protein